MRNSEIPKPWPEVLAAFADNELDPTTAAEVARRLPLDLQARQELADQAFWSPENRDLWHRLKPPEVRPVQWAMVWRLIDQGVSAAQGNVIRRPHSTWWRRWMFGALVAASASAAATVMAFCLPQPPCTTRPAHVNSPADEVFSIIDPAHVAIWSVHDADVPQILAGTLTMADDLPLIQQRNVRLHADTTNWESFTETNDQEDKDAPLILAPRVRSR